MLELFVVTCVVIWGILFIIGQCRDIVKEVNTSSKIFNNITKGFFWLIAVICILLLLYLYCDDFIYPLNWFKK